MPSAVASRSAHRCRRHVRDQRGDPVVIDWRAPHRAGVLPGHTTSDRMGVRLRRRFRLPTTASLTSYEDEHLDRGEALGPESDLLRQEIESAHASDRCATSSLRSSPTKTISSAPIFDTSLCIQGAPGTGKTAVAGSAEPGVSAFVHLPRAACAGPATLVIRTQQRLPCTTSRKSCRPSAEAAIEQTTVDELRTPRTGPGDRGRRYRHPLKGGDARMSGRPAPSCSPAYVARADWRRPAHRQGQLRRFRVAEHRLRRYIDNARRADIRWSTARERFCGNSSPRMASRRQREDAGAAPTDAETAGIARAPAVRGVPWTPSRPALDAPSLLARLYTDPALPQRCPATTLNDDEARRPRLAIWPRAPSGRRRWTVADTVPIDELVGLLTPALPATSTSWLTGARTFRRCNAGPSPAGAHSVP